MKSFAPRVTLVLGFPLIFCVFMVAMLCVRSLQWIDKVVGDVKNICKLFVSVWQTT